MNNWKIRFYLLAILIPILFLFVFIIPVSSGTYTSIKSINTDGFPEIRVQFRVTGPSAYDISELNDRHVQIYEDGYRANYIKLKSNDDIAESKSVLLLFVFRSRLAASDLKRLTSAAHDVISSLNEKDKAAIYGYDSKHELNPVHELPSKRNKAFTALSSIKSRNRENPLFNAIYDAVDAIKGEKANKKYAVLFTDGCDSGSNVTDDDIISAARDNHISVSIVGTKRTKSMKRLKRIARLTGGSYVIINKSEHASASDIIKSYGTSGEFLLSYKSQLIPDDSIHKIEIKIRNDLFQDSDVSSVNIPTGNKKYNVTSSLIVGLLILIVIVLIIVLVMLVLVFRKNYSFNVKNRSESLAKKHTLEKAIELEERERIDEIETLAASDPDYKFSHAWLIEKEGPQSGTKYPIQWDECTIGRSKDNSIVIDDMGVSPHHAKIKCVRNGYYIFDLVSDNGTFLNEKKLLRPKLLNDWDVIEIGRTTLIFRGSKKPRD